MSNQVYKKGGTLGGARHGDSYQVHVLMLIFERAAKAGNTFVDFRLATEMEAAGKFDDAVLNWSCSSQPKWLFVQVKHKQKATKLTELSFFPVEDKDKDKGDFSMYKYLASMSDIMRNNCEFAGDKKFIIYTNCAIDSKIEKWFTQAELEEEIGLLPNNKEGFWTMNVDENRVKNMVQFINQDFVKLAKTIRAIFIDENSDFDVDILTKYRGALVQKVLFVEKKVAKFTPRFIKKIKLTQNEMLLRQQLFAEDSTLVQLQAFSTCDAKVVERLASKSKSANNLPCFITEGEVSDYFKRLIFAVNQPDNEELKAIIHFDLMQFSPTRGVTASDCYTELLYMKLQKLLYDRLGNTTECVTFLSNEALDQELTKLQQTIEQSSSSDWPTIKFNGVMQNLRVRFKDSLQLPDQFPLALITTTKGGLLTDLKLFNMFESKNYRFASFKDFKNCSIRKELCETLRKASSEIILLLQDDCINFEFNGELLETVLKNKNVNLILLTCDADRSKKFFGQHEYSTVSDRNSRLDKLDMQSQQMLLEKHVLFQGVELTLGEVFQTRKYIIRDCILEKIIQDETIEIGEGLPEVALKNYIPRVIRRCDSNDSTDSSSDDSDDDSKILSYYGENNFIQKLNNIFKRKDVLVLSAEPGMGKTTLWTHLTPLCKQTYTASWVINIKLQDCVNELRTVHHFQDLQMVTGALIRVCQIKTTFEQSLFTSFLRDGNTIIFLDGFDELPYDTFTSVMSFLKILQHHSHLLVNTRIHQRVVLESTLETVTFTLDPINRHEQMELLKSACDVPPNDQELGRRIEQLYSNIRSKSLEVADKIIGVPLMVVMLAEIYRPYVQEFLKSRDLLVLNAVSLHSLTLLDIFDRFAYSSFRRQSIEKQNLDVANPHTERLLHKQNYLYKGFVKLHSYLGLVKLVKQQKMHLIFREKKKLAEFQEQARLLDSAIVAKYENEVPYFVHGSFCEFFAAKCLFDCVSRMPLDHAKDFFVKKDGNRKAPKKQCIDDLYDLYHKVLRDYATVRKFFFLIAKENEDSLMNLDYLFWSMRPYPLLWACEEGFVELVKRLLEEDPSIVNDCKTKQKETALHLAAAQGDDVLCTLLLNAKVDQNAVNKNGQTALHVAASVGHYEVARALKARGASLWIMDRNQQNPLHLAAQAGHASIVRLITKKAFDVDVLNKRGWSALHLAVFNYHIEVVKILVAKKAQLGIGNATNLPMILGNLITHGHSKIAQILVEHEAKSCIDLSNIEEILLWAIKRNHVEIVESMKKARENLHFYDTQTFLCTFQLALRKQCFRIAEIIISNQTGECERDDYPLHAAAEAGSTECVAILLDRQADVDAVDLNGFTPLDLAVRKGHTDVVRMLRGTGSAINENLEQTAARNRSTNVLRCDEVQKDIQEVGEFNVFEEKMEKSSDHISKKKYPKTWNSLFADLTI